MLKWILFLASAFWIQAFTAELPAVQFAPHGSFKIAYRTFGKGTPLILINGGPGRSSKSFLPLAKKFSQKGFEVITFDQRGTGQSKITPLDESTITLEKMVADLEALRQHLGYQRIHILGHSFGAIYASAYAADYPQHIYSLILSSSPGLDLKWQRDTKKNMLKRLSQEERFLYKTWTEINTEHSREANLKSLELLLPAYIYNRKHLAVLKKSLLHPAANYFTINTFIWKDLNKKNFNLKGKFKKLTFPTFIIAGNKDFFPSKIHKSLHHEFQNSKLEILSKSAHYPWLDQPEKFFSLVESFVKAQLPKTVQKDITEPQPLLADSND